MSPRRRGFPDLPTALSPNLDFVLGLSPSAMTLGLANIRALLGKLGDPQKAFQLTLSPQDADIAVGVSDTGCGIPGEDLPHIFDRFYRMEKTQSGKTGYSGLGLAIARRILELHDKPIRVESTPGSGTTFTFLLPAHQPA